LHSISDEAPFGANPQRSIRVDIIERASAPPKRRGQLRRLPPVEADYVNHAARRRERPRKLSASKLDFYSLTRFSACHEFQGNGLWAWSPLSIGIGLICINERIQLGYGLLKRHQRCSCGGDQVIRGLIESFNVSL
jgi:hypothetical protein